MSPLGKSAGKVMSRKSRGDRGRGFWQSRRVGLTPHQIEVWSNGVGVLCFLLLISPPTTALRSGVKG